MTYGNSTYRYSTDIFLRLLGGVYLIAFYSLWTQIHGLIGARGILPATLYFERAAQALGPSGWWQLPSLLWWTSSDAALSVFCFAGMMLSALMILGMVPLASSLLLWIIYLSLTVGGQDFLGYQWDNLLLECGFLAILAAPPVWRSKPSTNPRPPRLVVFLLHWLLFRLMFSAGYVKWASGDPSWRDLTALTFHFWTQPLPTWTAWYYQQAPWWFLKASTAAMFFIELVVPFLVFGRRALRAAAFAALVFLQVMIAATGNYGFFNLLAIVLCFPLLDDRWFAAGDPVQPPFKSPVLGRVMPLIRWPACCLVLTVSTVLFASTLKRDISWPGPVRKLVHVVMPFRSVNSYGLFAAMTKSRREIIIEGSRDGRNWMPYEFKYKPGDVHRTPLFSAPHMPRLDWQMWFAALGSCERNPWFLNFMTRLLEAQPDVLDLLASNPFGHEPPRHLRAILYDYTFASRQDNRELYLWWNRELKGLYCPVLSLEP